MKYIAPILNILLILSGTQVFGQGGETLYNGISFYEIVKEYEKKQDSLETDKQSQAGVLKEDVFNRWKWFWKYRVDQRGGFQEYARNMQQVAMNQKPSAKSKMASKIIWNPIGPVTAPLPNQQTCSYRNSLTGLTQPKSIWANETDIYVGLAGGSLWKRNGSTWENLTKDYMILGVRDIEVDDLGKIYIATGFDGQGGSRQAFDAFGMGVVYSKDGGLTWITNSMDSIPSADLYMNKIIIHPTNREIVYALSRKTVYKSVDGGSTWVDTNAPSLSNYDIYTGMVMKENDPDTLFICSAGLKHDMGFSQLHGVIYKTTNGGNSWETTNLATNLKYSNEDPIFISLATTPDDPNGVYAIYSTELNSSLASLHSTLEKSSDGGLTWNTLVDKESLTAPVYMMHNMAISPINKNSIWIGSVGQYRYGVGLSTFVSTATSLHPDLRDYFFVESGGSVIMYQANDAGIYSSSDLGASWNNISDGIHGSLFYGIETSESDPSILIGGVCDCGTHLFDGSNWKNMCLGGDGGTCLINEFNTDNIFAQVNSKLHRSIDGGNNWSTSSVLTHQGYNKPLIQHPTIDKIYSTAIFNSEIWWQYVQFSTDQGSTWTTFYNPKVDGTVDDRISTMAISESNPDYFYLGKTYYEVDPDPDGYYLYEANLFRTPNNGGDWYDITPNIGSVLTEAPLITDIEIHPLNPDKVWITFCGLSEGNKVFYTENGGANWTNISYNLDNFPVMGVEYDNINQILYIANDLGVFLKDDESSTWSRMGDFPYAITMDIDLNRANGKLYAATWGNGLWETSIIENCYNGTSQHISPSETWLWDRNICSDIYVAFGNVLTISNCDVEMAIGSKILVTGGGKLVVDGGTIDNANISVKQGGELVLKNGGVLRQNYDDKLNVELGCKIDITDGEIQLIQQ